MTAASGHFKTLGYYSGYEDQELGFVGGLLNVNPNGRPIEFHCTVPFAPSHAQRVLYGATLSDYLLNEQIPETLLKKTRSKPNLLFVDDSMLNTVRRNFEIPTGLVVNTASAGDQQENPQENDSRFINWLDVSAPELETCRAYCSRDFTSDKQVIQNALVQIAGEFDLDEPFERLLVAIKETSKSAEAA